MVNQLNQKTFFRQEQHENATTTTTTITTTAMQQRRQQQRTVSFRTMNTQSDYTTTATIRDREQ